MSHLRSPTSCKSSPVRLTYNKGGVYTRRIVKTVPRTMTREGPFAQDETGSSGGMDLRSALTTTVRDSRVDSADKIRAMLLCQREESVGHVCSV